MLIGTHKKLIIALDQSGWISMRDCLDDTKTLRSEMLDVVDSITEMVRKGEALVVLTPSNIHELYKVSHRPHRLQLASIMADLSNHVTLKDKVTDRMTRDEAFEYLHDRGIRLDLRKIARDERRVRYLRRGFELITASATIEVNGKLGNNGRCFEDYLKDGGGQSMTDRVCAATNYILQVERNGKKMSPSILYDMLHICWVLPYVDAYLTSDKLQSEIAELAVRDSGLRTQILFDNPPHNTVMRSLHTLIQRHKGSSP